MMQHNGSFQSLYRTLDPGVTLFSAAEIRIAIIPIGPVPPHIFETYVSLISTYRQVELPNVRSFYKEAQKSPFKFLPWKTGHMHLRFLPPSSHDIAARSDVMSTVYAHRRVWGVIGVMHCPSIDDISEAYSEFEEKCRTFHNKAVTIRCFAFNPGDDQVPQDQKYLNNFIMFPPGDIDHLVHHTEVVMHDFAACLLTELERWMLTASPALIDLNSYVDSQDFGVASEAAAVADETEEMKTKRRYARLQKALGDHSLLAGSPLDAQEHYATAVDLARVSNDPAFLGAALEGYASALALHAASRHDGFGSDSASVFNDDKQWRKPNKRLSSTLSDVASPKSDMLSQVIELSPSSPLPDSVLDDENGEMNEDESSMSEIKAIEPFTGNKFWGAMKASNVESEVRSLFADSKAALRKRGALTLLIESDLKFGKFLCGLNGHRARKEVLELMNAVQVAANLMPLPEDRLIAYVDAAQTLHSIQCDRRRLLLMWQAVEMAKIFDLTSTLAAECARVALECTLLSSQQGNTLLESDWKQVRAGCLEAVLGLAIQSKRHSDVWQMSALLLRDHGENISTHRMESLFENLSAAASHLNPEEKSRGFPSGPPPLLFIVAARPLSNGWEPVKVRAPQLLASPVGTLKRGPFLYDPFSARRKEKQKIDGESLIKNASPEIIEWVCGDVVTVDILVSNPTSIPIRVDRMTLEARLEGNDDDTTPFWKGKPVSLNIPPRTKPVCIQVEGIPLRPGELVLTGCRLTAGGGVTWEQNWSPQPVSVGRQLRGDGVLVHQPHPQRIIALPPLPKLEASFGITSHGDEVDASSPSSLGLVARRNTTPVIKLLQGQTYAASLLLTNTGKLAIDSISVTAIHAVTSLNRVHLSIDSDFLRDIVPLASGHSVSLPLTIGATVRHGHAAEDESHHEIVLEYCGHGNSNSTVEEGTDEPLMGRRAVVGFDVRVAAAAHISQIQFKEIFVPQERVVMLVTLVNKSVWPMEVWLDRSSADAHEKEEKEEKEEGGGGEAAAWPATLPMTCIIDANRKGTVAYVLPIDNGIDISRNTTESPISMRHRAMATYEEITRQLVAEEVANNFLLTYKIREGVRGHIPLIPGEIYNGLGHTLLAKLVPPAISVCISCISVQGEHIFDRITTDAGILASAQHSHLMEHAALVPAHRVTVGQMLHIEVHVHRHGRRWSSAHHQHPRSTTAHIEGSLSCGIMNGDDVAWVGRHTALPLDLFDNKDSDDGKKVYRCGMCCLSPGIYQVTMTTNTCEEGPLSKQENTLVSIRPCFISAITSSDG